MIKRYEVPEIAGIWCDENKLALWQRTELAVLNAKVKLALIPAVAADEIGKSLADHPCNVQWWLDRDRVVRHDLNAFLEERMRFIPHEYQQYFHQHMTSYDTEESAFVAMLRQSYDIASAACEKVQNTIGDLAKKHRYSVMVARTHGQWAKLQSFGKRCLGWLEVMREARRQLVVAAYNLNFSRLSGAVGNYGGISPEVEREALSELGFMPYYGASQIMPRILYAPLAQSLGNMVLQIAGIAEDVRLGARSGCVLWQEPFGKQQKGSSAMPHKKNTITCEQLIGMAREAAGHVNALTQNIVTWEERAIEQSCVERMSWPDKFHIAVYVLRQLERTLAGLQVYPDNMLREVRDCRKAYASDEAKELLKELGVSVGLTAEECYRIVQLASFNVFKTPELRKHISQLSPVSYGDVERLLDDETVFSPAAYCSIESVIAQASLIPLPELGAEETQVTLWNAKLSEIFSSEEARSRWSLIFKPSFLLRHESHLFAEIIGD